MTSAPRSGRLARLDARLLPGLARALRASGRGVRRIGRLGGPPGRWAVRAARRNPTIATAVIAVIVGAILIVTTGGDLHRAVAPPPPNPQVVLPGDQLGPAPGEQVSTYLTAVAQRREDLAVAKSGNLTAVVDFNSYLTAAAVESLLAGRTGVQATRAFVRVAPPADGQVHAVTLTPGSDLAQDLDTLAATAHETVTSYRKRVALAKAHPTAQNVQVVTEYAGLARQARVDAAGLGASRACVFALAVTGPPVALQELAKVPDIRVLDPAPASVPPAELMIVPLEPQVTNIVPALAFARD